jgi:hypothetical protein
MKDDEFRELVGKLPLLTKAQMTDVRRRLGFLIGGASEGQQSDWLLEGVLSELRRRGLGHMVPPSFTIRKSNSYHGYETQADRVRLVLTAAVPNMTLPETMSMGAIAAKCLADFILTWKRDDGGKFEVSLETMLHNIHQVPAALDAAFPGYLESGMMGFLLRRKT